MPISGRTKHSFATRLSPSCIVRLSCISPIAQYWWSDSTQKKGGLGSKLHRHLNSADTESALPLNHTRSPPSQLSLVIHTTHHVSHVGSRPGDKDKGASITLHWPPSRRSRPQLPPHCKEKLTANPNQLLQISKTNGNDRCCDCGAPSPQWVRDTPDSTPYLHTHLSSDAGP